MTPEFETMPLPARPDVRAPDGSDVRILPRLAGGSMAHFELGPGRVSLAVVHGTVEEIWYVVAGRGEMWRRQGGREEVVTLAPGMALTIPVGTHFQFRAGAAGSLGVVAITMPPWPGVEEAIVVAGPWPASEAAT